MRTLPGRVTDMQNYIGDGHVVECRIALWIRQGQLPCALRAGSLEGQETFITQIGFKQPRIVAGAAGDYRLNGAAVVQETIIPYSLARVFAVFRNRRRTHAAPKEGKRAVDIGIRADHRRYREADALDAAHIVP